MVDMGKLKRETIFGAMFVVSVVRDPQRCVEYLEYIYLNGIQLGTRIW